MRKKKSGNPQGNPGSREAKRKLDEFSGNGGVLESKAALPVGWEFVEAFTDLGRELAKKDSGQ